MNLATTGRYRLLICTEDYPSPQNSRCLSRNVHGFMPRVPRSASQHVRECADWYDSGAVLIGPEQLRCARSGGEGVLFDDRRHRLPDPDRGGRHEALEKFILEQLTAIPGIEKIRSSFTLKQVRCKTALPLPAP